MLRNLTAWLLALGVAASVSAQRPRFNAALGTYLALAGDAVSAVLSFGFSLVRRRVRSPSRFRGTRSSPASR